MEGSTSPGEDTPCGLSVQRTPRSPPSSQPGPQGGDAMAPALPALLCLGLSVGLRTQVQAGTLPKSTIWAEPGSVVLWGSPVTIWCWGTLWAQGFRLGKEGSPVLWDRQKPLEPRDKARFSIQHMGEDHAGSYRCYYSTPTGWSEPSDPLELVVTGLYGKPRLSALPSPVVTSGGSVTLQCGSHQGFNIFLLTKDGEDKSSWTLAGQRSPDGWTQALFLVGPVTPGHRWRFRCYGFSSVTPRVWSAPSDPLELLVAGTLPKPTIWAEPGSVVPSGTPVTIWCQGTLEAQVFHLDKEGTSVRRLRDRPSLSVRPGPSVAPGENVTLLCQSGNRTDTFLLSKEGAAHRPLRLRSKDQARRYQAEFSLSPVTSAHGGTYRCYGSLSTDPYLLSQPSEPLALVVS
ncbi:PREDICTED: leukocyte immunoglobulin-like receptor subfamily A member 5, partial [Bison bison bison]|uniref:Leukocyte immunoglobulin-like receptor subfamily A member 5 n=1 Tax=Bison bison bison TaxID=43346 RepID=A0A6P3HSU8_BISBB